MNICTNHSGTRGIEYGLHFVYCPFCMALDVIQKVIEAHPEMKEELEGYLSEINFDEGPYRKEQS